MPENPHKKQNIAVIIPAAGIGSRMGGTEPKQFLEIEGVPLFIYTLYAFMSCSEINEIIVAATADMQEKMEQLCKEYFGGEERLRFVIGGKRRQDSVKEALAVCTAPLVMVHDAARPLISGEIIEKCCQALQRGKSFITAVPVVDTIKKVAENKVTATIDRRHLMRAQTPQGAPAALLRECFARLTADGDRECTDESSLLEYADIPVEIVAGEESNFKITRWQDLRLAESLLKNILHSSPVLCRKKSSVSPVANIYPGNSPRIGHGFDAHRLTEKRKLILGGVEIPFEKGLAGHSDADVVTHAVCDALLGAAGCGDIGKAFPDSDNAFKDIYSILLLERVAEKISNKCDGQSGWQIGNIDITLICQAPKIAPYIDEMKEKIAGACCIEKRQINIKATTEEKMGYTGRGEGISCHAAALLFLDTNK